MNKPTLGETPTVNVRDAVHVAIFPMIAGDLLQPGTRVKIYRAEAVETSLDDYIGVVDPFGPSVSVGQTFWMLMRPGTVRDLRHNWSCDELPDSDGGEENLDPYGCISMGCNE